MNQNTYSYQQRAEAEARKREAIEQAETLSQDVQNLLAQGIVVSMGVAIVTSVCHIPDTQNIIVCSNDACQTLDTLSYGFYELRQQVKRLQGK